MLRGVEYVASAQMEQMGWLATRGVQEGRYAGVWLVLCGDDLTDPARHAHHAIVARDCILQEVGRASPVLRVARPIHRLCQT